MVRTAITSDKRILIAATCSLIKTPKNVIRNTGLPAMMVTTKKLNQCLLNILIYEISGLFWIISVYRPYARGYTINIRIPGRNKEDPDGSFENAGTYSERPISASSNTGVILAFSTTTASKR